MGSSKTNLGKFYKLSQMLADKSKTLKESYAGAMDGDLNKEAARKERFRGMLQESVIEYAQILLALNELADTMKTEWKVRVDTKQRVQPLNLAWGPTASSLDDVIKAANQDEPQNAPKVPVVDQKVLRKAFAASRAAYDPKTGVLTLGYDFARSDQQLKDWDLSEGKPLKVAKGIRILPGDRLVSNCIFTEGEFSVQAAIEREGDQGSILGTTDEITLEQHTNGSSRQFTVRIIGQRGVSGFADRKTSLDIVLSVDTKRIRLKANNAEAGSERPSLRPFSFVLCGGDNGLSVYQVVIKGKPDPASWEELLR